MALYRDKLTMESAGEIWIEEESPIYLQMKSQVQPLSNGTSMQEVKLEETKLTEVPSDKDEAGDSPILEPIKVVEVEVQEPLDTFSRLGQGLSLATSFVKETTKQAAEELNEFKVIFYHFIYSCIHRQNDINFSNIIFIRIHKDTKIL